MKYNQQKISEISANTANIILVCLLSVAAILIMYNANWTLGDDDQFIRTTVVGQPIMGWCSKGRFWPLGLFDCSILLFVPFGHTITMHMAYCCTTMIISVILMFNLLKKVTNHDYIASIIPIVILFFSSSFMRIHMLCTFAERFMFTLFSLIMLCIWMAERSKKTKYYICAFIASVYVTYMKEPTFGALLIIILTKLIFSKEQMNKKDKIFYILLAINSLTYFFIYLYVRTKTFPTLIGVDSILYQLQNEEPLLWGVIILGIVRGFKLVFQMGGGNHRENNLLLDAFLFAGIGYMCAIFILGLASDYYTFPTLVLSLPSFAHYLHKIRINKNVALLSAFTAVFLTPCIIRSANKEYRNIKYILKCRSNDMAAIEYVVNQCKQGKNIVFVMPKNNSTEQWCSTLPENAIKTVFGFQDIIYKRQTDFSGINENSIVILPSWQINKTDQLNNVSVMNDFYLYFKDAFIGIYVPKK